MIGTDAIDPEDISFQSYLYREDGPSVHHFPSTYSEALGFCAEVFRDDTIRGLADIDSPEEIPVERLVGAARAVQARQGLYEEMHEAGIYDEHDIGLVLLWGLRRAQLNQEATLEATREALDDCVDEWCASPSEW